MTFALVIHGGAGARRSADYSEQKQHLAEVVEAGRDMLATGGSALDTVTEMVARLEASGHYVAGKGSAPNSDGIIQLDASIMDGRSRAAGAVAALSNFVHPIKAARAVMENSSHVMFAGAGANAFALANGLEAVPDSTAYYNRHIEHGSAEKVSHGTVGAVALDLAGNLAAATSTGGTFNKRPGRVGDTPLIGAGTWADDTVAVSCTGIGEAFIRAGAAHDVSARVRYGGATLDVAAAAVLDEVKQCDGDGGLISVDRSGNISMPFNSNGMKRAAISDRMEAVVRIFEAEPGG